MEQLTSRDNPLLKRVRALLRDGAAYRRSGAVWLEGDHLVRAALTRGWLPKVLIWTEAGKQQWPEGLGLSTRHVGVDADVMRELTNLETPTKLGGLFEWHTSGHPREGQPTVVLDRLQDPGNAGSILRSAAAMGFRQVVALRGTVALWSPKVVRAGMGAHFALHMVEQAELDDLSMLNVPLLATSSHHGEWLQDAELPWPCAWVMGHEGQGVSEALMARADQTCRIVQPGGEESLNVAAAAAICLHASAISACKLGL